MGTVAVRLVCVRGREEYAIILYFFSFYIYGFFVAIQTLSASFNALSVGNGIWPFSFFMTAFCSDTGLFPPFRRHVHSICREWHLSFLLCYHIQCLTHTSLTPVLGGGGDYKCTSDYPIHAGAACPTQKPFSASCIKC